MLITAGLVISFFAGIALSQPVKAIAVVMATIAITASLANFILKPPGNDE
jgi:hypothetical protein